MKLRVAGGQIEVTRDVRANVAAIQRAIDFAAGEGADILLTPEGSLSGYCHDLEPSEVADALEQVTAQARQASCSRRIRWEAMPAGRPMMPTACVVLMGLMTKGI